MKCRSNTILLPALLLSLLLLPGCSGNVNRALYEGIKSQNEAYKTPTERSMTPTPSYDSYQTERERLQQHDSATEIKPSPNTQLK